MIHGLIVTHGQLGEELLRIAEQILGASEGLACLSNNDLSVPGLTAAIRDWLDTADQNGAGGAVIFVDDVGGSPANSARIACAGRPRVTILSGVNLAMFLSFVTGRETVPWPELTDSLLTKGRHSIAALDISGKG